MALWNEFVNGALPYQGYWMPLMIGMAAGMVCVFVGNLVWRGKKSKVAQSAQVQSQHDPFVQGSLTEQRKSVRRTGNPVEALYARPDNRNVANRALVLDRSLGGLRLGVDEEIVPGSRLVVLPMNASEVIPWIEMEVRECVVVDDSWELHCQFVKTPQWSILLLFG